MPAINVTCPNPACLRTLRVEDRFLGKKVKCKFCSQPLLIEVQAEPPVAPPDLSTMQLSHADNVFEQQTIAGAAPVPMAEPIPMAAPAGWPDVRSDGPPPLPPAAAAPPKLKVGALVVSLVSLAVICGSVAGIVTLRRPAAAKDGTANAAAGPIERHAAIALESGGVRLVVAPLRRAGDSYELGELELQNKRAPLAVQPGEPGLNPDKLGPAMRVVGEFIQVSKGRNVPDANLLVVCNSGVLKELEKDPAALARAKATLEQKVRDAGGADVTYITADDEARFGAIGCVPPEDRVTSVLLDLGNSAAKCGYHDAGGAFTGFGITPLGRRTFTVAVNDERPRPRPAAPFPKKGPGQAPKGGPSGPRPFVTVAEELRPSHLNAPLARTARDWPALTARKKYHLLGGVAWAAATLTHPAEVGEKRVTLTAKDVQNLDALVSGSPSAEAVKAKVLGPLPAGPAKDRATKEVGAVIEDQGHDGLVASAKILRALADECDFGTKSVQFFRDSLYAWPLGYLLVRSGVEK